MGQSPSMKDRIIDTAWRLFYEKGYDNTTVDEIIQECGVSKGGFYHHFRAKDDLLTSLSSLLDSQYEIALEKLDPAADSYEKLLFLSRYLFRYIEERVPVDILSLVYSTQVVKKGERYLMDQSRVYYRVLNEILREGQERRQIINTRSWVELAKFYALQERAVLYDWCICEGSYSLSSYGMEMLEFFVHGMREQEGSSH